MRRLQALTTQLVAPDQQGRLQGATTSVQSVSQLVGPILFTLTFAYFIGAQAPLKLPGAPFLLASALLVLALLLAALHAVAPRGRLTRSHAGSLKLMQRAGLVVIEFAGLGPGRRAHRHDEFRGLIRRVERHRIFAGKHAWRASVCGSGRD